MGLLADGESFLCDVFDETESVLIDYAVSPYTAAQTITINATPGEPVSELEPGAFTTNASLNRDFIVRYGDLVIGQSRVIPDVGHRITQTSDGITYTYEVMDAPGDGAWRWHGTEYKAYRIHATLIGRA